VRNPVDEAIARIAERRRISGELNGDFVGSYLGGGRDVAFSPDVALIGPGVAAGDPPPASSARGFLDDPGYFAGRDTVDHALDPLFPRTKNPALVLSGRHRQGTASLIGFQQFTSSPTPPTFYLVQTYGGGFVVNYGYNQFCNNSPVGQLAGSDSGALSYDPVTGAFSSTHVHTGDSSYGMGCGFGTTYTPTTETDYTIAGCCQNTAYYYFYESVSSSGTRTLSVPDTESNAINRLFAGSSGTWSAWTKGSAVSCLARYQQRTLNQFVIQEAEYELAGSGLTPGATYTVNLRVWRRTYNVGSYSLFATLPVSGTVDSTGNLAITGDVPNLVGYDTYVSFP
jgi:hypothetical protein